jgi:hypothetical protein
VSSSRIKLPPLKVNFFSGLCQYQEYMELCLLYFIRFHDVIFNLRGNFAFALTKYTDQLDQEATASNFGRNTRYLDSFL